MEVPPMKPIRAAIVVFAVFACGCASSKPMFQDDTLEGWRELGSDGAWSIEDGVVRCTGERTDYAWLGTERKYADFELTFEWKIEPGGNAGVFLRAPDFEGRTSMKGLEIQMKDDREDKDLTDVSGAVFRRIPASGRYANPPGQWNHYRLTFKGRRLKIVLNGRLVSDTNIDTVKPKEGDPPMSDIPDEGHIGLQNHGDPVAFRNVRIQVVE
jgi:hypothetical protein